MGSLEFEQLVFLFGNFENGEGSEGISMKVFGVDSSRKESFF